MPIRKPTRISVSARLQREGFGRNTSILRGTVVLSGFKVTDGFRNGTVRVTWVPGSDFDHLDGDAYRQEVERQRDHMAGLYAKALSSAGYDAKSSGCTVTVQA